MGSGTSCQYRIDNDFMNMLSELEKDDIYDEILKECAPLIVEEEKKQLKHIKSGSLVKSIKATTVKKNAYGRYIVVRPTGKDKNGVRNMEKFVYLEYGTSNQKADPIQKKVTNLTTDAINKKCEEIFKRYVK